MSTDPTGRQAEGDLGAGFDVTGSVSYGGAVERVLRAVRLPQDTEADRFVELRDDARAGQSLLDGHPGRIRDRAQCTIFESGNSMMSVAPASESAGMRMLISFFGTTVSTA